MLGDPRMSGASDPASKDPFVTLTITPDSGLAFTLDTMEAAEELGRPFLIVLDVSSETPQGDTHAVLGSSATLELKHPTKPTRYFNGIVARISYRGLTGGAYRYRLELRPWLWLLSHQQDCRIFSTKSPWTIITGLFRDAGFTDFADKRQNASGDAVARLLRAVPRDDVRLRDPAARAIRPVLLRRAQGRFARHHLRRRPEQPRVGRQGDPLPLRPERMGNRRSTTSGIGRPRLTSSPAPTRCGNTISPRRKRI